MSINRDLADSAEIQPFGDNLIINGDMRIGQRGYTFVSPTNTDYTLDRWMWTQVGQGAVTVARYNSGQGINDKHYNDLRVDVTTADTSLLATDIYLIRQKIEGRMLTDSGWGAASAQDMTLSFVSNHTLAGTYCVALRNETLDRSYIAEYTQASGDTWEQQEITIPGDVTGTWDRGTGIGIELNWIIATSPTSSWVGTADSWTSTNDLNTANQVNGMGSTSYNFRLANVKLEYGSAATSFVSRPFSVELDMCRRYYEKSYNLGVTPGTVTALGADWIIISGIAVSTHLCGHALHFQTNKRAAPAVTCYSPVTGASGYVYDYSATAGDRVVTLSQLGQGGFWWYATTNGSKASAQMGVQWEADAEL